MTSKLARALGVILLAGLSAPTAMAQPEPTCTIQGVTYTPGTARGQGLNVVQGTGPTIGGGGLRFLGTDGPDLATNIFSSGATTARSRAVTTWSTAAPTTMT